LASAASTTPLRREVDEERRAERVRRRKGSGASERRGYTERVRRARGDE
jgi:hypothetical protein